MNELKKIRALVLQTTNIKEELQTGFSAYIESISMMVGTMEQNENKVLIDVGAVLFHIVGQFYSRTMYRK